MSSPTPRLVGNKSLCRAIVVDGQHVALVLPCLAL